MTFSKELQNFLHEGIRQGLFSGACAAVRTPEGTLYTAAAGLSTVKPVTEPATESTLWDLASLTKPLVTATAVLLLTQDRLLSLDDPIGRFADVYKKSHLEGVTLRRLLSHSAGVVDWFPVYVRGEGRAAYRKTLSSLDAADIPGRRVLYSCIGYLMLSDAIETAAGAPLDVFFAHRIAQPLNVQKDLLFTPGGEDMSRTAGGEENDETERRMVAERNMKYAGFRVGPVRGEVNDGNAFRRGNGVSGNAGLFGTAAAVLEVAGAWLCRDPRLLTGASFETAFDVESPPESEARYGLGWHFANESNSAGKALSKDSYGHTGSTGTSLWIDPVAKRAFALLTNQVHPAFHGLDLHPFRRSFHELGVSL